MPTIHARGECRTHNHGTTRPKKLLKDLDAPKNYICIYFLHIHIHIIQERVEYIHVKGPNEKGHVELAISKPKAGPAAVAAADSTMA